MTRRCGRCRAAEAKIRRMAKRMADQATTSVRLRTTLHRRHVRKVAAASAAVALVAGFVIGWALV